MFVARAEQLILTDGQTAWQQPSDLQWTTLCLICSILNDKKIVCILSHLHIQTYSKLRNRTHSLVNSLPAIAIDAHERQFFDKILWGLVTSMFLSVVSV